MSVYAPTPVVKRWFDGYRRRPTTSARARSREARALDPRLRGRDRRAGARRGPPAHRVALPQGPQAGPRARDATRLHVAELAARDALSARGQAAQRVTYEEIIDNGMAVVGSPDTVGERFEAMIDELGFGQIISRDGRRRHASLPDGQEHGALLTQVMPALRRRGPRPGRRPAATRGGGGGRVRGSGVGPRGWSISDGSPVVGVCAPVPASVMCPVGRRDGRRPVRPR